MPASKLIPWFILLVVAFFLFWPRAEARTDTVSWKPATTWSDGVAINASGRSLDKYIVQYGTNYVSSLPVLPTATSAAITGVAEYGEACYRVVAVGKFTDGKLYPSTPSAPVCKTVDPTIPPPEIIQVVSISTAAYKFSVMQRGGFILQRVAGASVPLNTVCQELPGLEGTGWALVGGYVGLCVAPV